MYSIRWLAFGISHSLSRTVVHFFPCSSIVTAPYPVNTKIEVFSANFGKQAISLEGARLHQPDGIKLEAAFPVVADGVQNGPYGISIEVSSAGQRIDLQASQCIIELVSANGRIRYRATPCVSSSSKETPLVCSVFKDSKVETSLVFVNESSTAMELSGLSDASLVVAANSVTETKLSDQIFQSGVEYQSEKELHKISSVTLPSNLVTGAVTGFIVERDLASQRVVNISNMETV